MAVLKVLLVGIHEVNLLPRDHVVVGEVASHISMPILFAHAVAAEAEAILFASATGQRFAELQAYSEKFMPWPVKVGFVTQTGNVFRIDWIKQLMVSVDMYKALFYGHLFELQMKQFDFRDPRNVQFLRETVAKLKNLGMATIVSGFQSIDLAEILADVEAEIAFSGSKF